MQVGVVGALVLPVVVTVQPGAMAVVVRAATLELLDLLLLQTLAVEVAVEAKMAMVLPAVQE
jgi:hypothetical protein